MEKKKSLGTLVLCALLIAAFVAVVKQGVRCCCITFIDNGDPFWVIFGVIIWGSSAGLVWLMLVMVWKEEI